VYIRHSHSSHAVEPQRECMRKFLYCFVGYVLLLIMPSAYSTFITVISYVAPEILKNHPHDEMVDMWSVGVIIYVLLVGYPPFMEERQKDLFRKIRQGEYGFDGKDWKKISKSAKKLIKSLLVVDPSHRMTAKKALTHKWIMSQKSLTRSLHDSQRQLQTVVRISRNEMCARLPASDSADDDMEYKGNAIIDDDDSDTDDSDDYDGTSFATG